MIYFVTSLHCEAKPLIKHFNLKKHKSSKFEIYGNEEVNLIISGIGMFKCAIASTYLFSTVPPCYGSIAVNLGICGSVRQDFDEGKMFIINKIINSTNNKTYYPDMILRHGMPESPLETFLSPVVKSETAISADLVDMEASGFMEATSAFFPSHSIYCLKVVSDHLEGARLTTDYVSELINRNLPEIDKLIKNAAAVSSTDRNVLTDKDLDLIDKISGSLGLSVTLTHQLRSYAVHYKLKYNKDLDFLQEYTGIAINNKEERKKHFDSIKKLLTSG